MKRASTHQGFTVIEIIIVIVVLAILATITAVSYNGTQQRAKITKAKADMQSLGESFENYITLEGQLPSSSNVPEYVALLKEAGLYEQTRDFDKSSFAICVSNDRKNYAIVAWHPIIEGYKKGDVIYTYTQSEQQEMKELENSSLSSSHKLRKACDMVLDGGFEYTAWTSDIK